MVPGRKYYRGVVTFIHSCVTHSADMQLCLLFTQRSGRCCLTSLSYFCQNNCDSAKMWDGRPVAEGLCDVKEDPGCSVPQFLFHNRKPSPYWCEGRSDDVLIWGGLTACLILIMQKYLQEKDLIDCLLPKNGFNEFLLMLF